jgi:arylsulfatase A-like enzyme
VRNGDWKLVTDGQDRTELYRLPDDWSEQHNIAQEHPEKLAELTAKLTAWRTSLPKEPAAHCISKEGRARMRDRTKN